MSRDYHADNRSFMVYKDWEELLYCLDSDEEVGKLFKALFAFAARGEQAEFTGALKMAFAVMRRAIERDGKKWEDTCAVRSDNGKQGGRPKKAKEADTVTETAKEKATELAIDSEKEAVSAHHLTAAQTQLLISDYGRSITELYTQKLASYISEKRSGKPYKDNAATVRRWIEEDKARGMLHALNSENGKSYDIDDFDKWLADYVPKLSDSLKSE